MATASSSAEPSTLNVADSEAMLKLVRDEDSSEDDEDPLKQKALYVDLSDESAFDKNRAFDLSQPPMTVEEHILRARLEDKILRSKQKELTTVDGSSGDAAAAVNSSSAIAATALTCPIRMARALEACTRGVISSEEAIGVKEVFERHRHRLMRFHEELYAGVRKLDSKYQEQAREVSAVVTAGFRDLDNYIQSHTPSPSLLLALSHVNVNRLLQELCRMAIKASDSESLHSSLGTWIMGILATIPTPVDEDTICALRSFAKFCKKLVSETGDSSKMTSAKKLYRFVIIIALAAPFFQRDLLYLDR